MNWVHEEFRLSTADAEVLRSFRHDRDHIEIHVLVDDGGQRK